MTIDTCGSSFDTVLGVYTGDHVDDLTVVAVNDDGGDPCYGLTSKVVFPATTGTTYHVAVAGYPIAQGTIELSLRVQPPGPANDHFADAQILDDALPLTVSGTNVRATREWNEPMHGTCCEGLSVWYRWTAPVSTSVTFETCGSSFDTNLAVYRGAALASLTTVVKSGDGCGLQSVVTFAATAGTTYHIAVEGTDFVRGTIELTLKGTDRAPANDDFANARALSGRLPMTVHGTNVQGTVEAGEPDHVANEDIGPSVWYRWTPKVSGRFVIDTCDSRFWSMVAVYTGTSLNKLTPVASNEGACGFQGSLQFDAAAGTEYRIAVAGRAGTQGATVLELRAATPPVNDDFAQARELRGKLPLRARGSNLDATHQTGEPGDYVSLGGGRSAWWRWTATATQRVTVETCGSAFDGISRTGLDGSLLGVWTGTSVDALTRVPNQLIGNCGADTTLTFTAVAGTTYRIAVDGGIGGEQGDIRLTIRTAKPPANDDFADAVELPSHLPSHRPVRVRSSNIDATQEAGEDNHEPGNLGSRAASVWYRWTPTTSGTVTFETCGSSYTSQLAIYTGTAVNDLTNVVKSTTTNSCGANDRVTFRATAGTTYHIAVDGTATQQGDIVLGARPTTPPANDQFANARVLTGRLPAGSTGTTVGATMEAGESWHAEWGSGRSVWYRWTPRLTGEVVVETCGSDQPETQLEVYTGAAVDALTSVTSSDDECGSHGRVRFTAAAGTTYAIAVATAGSRLAGGEGGIKLTIRPPDPPANDDFANSRVLRGHLPIKVRTANDDTTIEPGEPFHAGPGSASIWYSWKPQATGEYTIDTHGTDFGTTLAVYTGTSLDNLTRVATGADDFFTWQNKETNRVTFSASVGTTYRIAVATPTNLAPGGQGPMQLTISCDHNLPHCRR